jgi:hypothetical protein
MNKKNGKMCDKRNGKKMKIDVDIDRGLIVKRKFSINIIEEIVKEYYFERNGRV